MKNEAGGGGSLQGNELKLDDQCLSSLPGWVVETPRHAAVLKILYLNKNQFTRLPALLGLPHLEKLNMAGNSLSVIHAGVLPPSLLVLELINNQITTIEPGAFAALRKPTLRGTLSPSRIATRSRLTSSTARSSRSAATGCGTSSRTNRRWMPSSRPPRSTNAAPRRFATLRSCTGRQTTSAAATATSRRRHHLN